MTMEEYGRLMVNYKDTPAEQQQKQTRQMSYVESNIDWWVSMSNTETFSMTFAGPTSVSLSASCANQVESSTRRTRSAST